MLIISIIYLIIAIAYYSTPVKGFASVGLSPILISRLTSIIFLFSGALTFNALYIQSIGSGIGLYSGNFQVTVLSQSIDLFLLVMASLILIPWSNKRIKLNNSDIEGNNTIYSYISNGPHINEYSLILLFSTLGSSLLLSSANLVSMYLAIELQSFGVYILATVYRNSESATNAGLKYFLLGGLSSCFILLGSGLIYSYTGITSFEGLYSLISVIGLNEGGPEGVLQGLQLGLIFIFIGLLFKISAAPFHNWAPDVYNDVPTIVTTWLTIMPKIALVMLIIEIVSNISLNIESIGHNLLQLNMPYDNIFTNLFLISSLFSLLIGTVLGLSQTKIKRLFAYSTVSHVGFMLLCIGINTEESLESVLFYLIQYSITNFNAFLILLSFGYIINKIRSVNNLNSEAGDISLIRELKGQFYNNPLLTLSLAVCLFSMAGIPPLIGFFAKQQVLYSSIHNGYYFISIIAIIVSVISASYYLKIIKVMHFDEQAQVKGNMQDVNNITSTSEAGENMLTNSHAFLISVLTLSLLLFMLKPSILLNSTHLIALSIFIY